MNTSGHIKDQTSDDNGNRQFVVNCLGSNDQRKYFSLSPFGIDFNPPENTRSLTANSSNKDVNYNLGVLNKIKIDDLARGESAIFSTNEEGSELVSQIVLRNTGDIEINKGRDNGNVLIKADGTIEINGNTDFLVGYTKLQEGFEELKSDYNSHIHKIPIGSVIESVSGGSGSPAVGTPNVAAIDLSTTDTESAASIDSSKKDNLKIE